jgi:HAD superfamily hydrolase (TIGR01509 family)
LASREVRAVLFDFDGTLTKPGGLDFSRIRREIGCPDTVSILTYIDELEDDGERERATNALLRFERAAAEASEPNVGAESLVEELSAHGVPISIQTRNTLGSVEIALRKFHSVTAEDFTMLITREGEIPPKPDPAGIRRAAAAMGVRPEEVLVVGDYLYELEAADVVGCVSAFLSPGLRARPTRPGVLDRSLALAAYEIDNLRMILDILRLHRPLPMGKVPNDLLAELIRMPEGRSVVVGPAAGEDVAVVAPEASRMIAIKSDPITFATDRPGNYAVTINANDIATSGAQARWMSVCLLFPPDTLPATIRSMIDDLRNVATDSSIDVVGGHTEITDAVVRPVISASLVGVVAEEKLLRKESARENDVLIMTKAAGIEGTAILASEADEALREAEVDSRVLEEARALAGLLSVTEEARIAAEHPGTRCLHDVTEGGIVTAIEEVSMATGRTVTVDLDAVLIRDCTRAVCRVLSVDPLGLIGSGCLLICVDPDGADRLVRALEAEGVAAAQIGRLGRCLSGQSDGSSDDRREAPRADRAGRSSVEGARSGDETPSPLAPEVTARRGGKPVSWPRFETDELARYLEG